MADFAKVQLSDAKCERDVIGALLTYNNLLSSIAPSEDAFYNPENATVYRAIAAIIDEGRTADIISVMEYSNKKHLNIDLLRLTECDGTCLDVTYRQNVIRLNELAARRKVYQLSRMLEAVGTNEAADLREVIDKVNEQLTAITTASTGNREDYTIDLTQNYPEPQYIIMQDGIGTMPRGDLQAIKAKSKNGKSYLSSIFAASILGCEAFGFRTCERDTRVLYCDTEQNKLNTARIVRRVHYLMGWSLNGNNARMQAVSLRSMATKDRLPYISKIVKRNAPTAVFVDGIADLIEDFNNIEQSTKVINALMRLSTEHNTAVICILHENKGKDDSGMKGHLGTMLLQKASDIFQVQKNNGKFDVSVTDCRNMPIEDFSFAIDGHGIPMPAAALKEDKKAAKVEELRTLIKLAFTEKTELSYTELCRMIVLYGAVSERTAKRKVKEAIENNVICVSPNAGYYMVI